VSDNAKGHEIQNIESTMRVNGTDGYDRASGIMPINEFQITRATRQQCVEQLMYRIIGKERQGGKRYRRIK
jgi:hypothetical protein